MNLESYISIKAHKYGYSTACIEDLEQEARMAVWQKTNRNKNYTTSYLKQCAKWTMLNYLRSRKQLSGQNLKIDLILDNTTSSDNTWESNQESIIELIRGNDNVEDIVDARLKFAKIINILNCLELKKPKNVKIFRLHLKGFKNQELFSKCEER